MRTAITVLMALLIAASAEAAFLSGNELKRGLDSFKRSFSSSPGSTPGDSVAGDAAFGYVVGVSDVLSTKGEFLHVGTGHKGASL